MKEENLCSYPLWKECPSLKDMLKTIFKKTIPVLAGYMVLGMGFGLLLKVNGFGIWWALGMSVFIYAGSLQYVGVSLLAGGASFLTIAVTSLVINARHLFYGITMMKPYEGAGIKKLYLMHSLTDETYSIVCTKDVPEGMDPHKYYFGISFLNQIYWIIGSVIGALLGSVIPYDLTGLEFSMTALFVTVFIDQWRKEKEHKPAIIGLCSSVICLLIFGKDNFIIPDMMIIMVLLSLFRKKIEKEETP